MITYLKTREFYHLFSQSNDNFRIIKLPTSRIYQNITCFKDDKKKIKLNNQLLIENLKAQIVLIKKDKELTLLNETSGEIYQIKDKITPTGLNTYITGIDSKKKICWMMHINPTRGSFCKRPYYISDMQIIKDSIFSFMKIKELIKNFKKSYKSYTVTALKD